MMKANDLPSLIAVDERRCRSWPLPGSRTTATKTVLIAGTGDPLFPSSMAFAKQSPGSRMMEVAGANHVAVITNPQAVAAITEQLAITAK